MNIKYVIIGVVVLALVYIGYTMMKGQYASPTADTTPMIATDRPDTSAAPSDQQQTTQPGMSESTVEYTENGFNPKSLTVKVGTTVTWTNKTTDPLWVASAPHPQHTALPGFDALKGYNTGETYSYTFAKVGTWKYHNHLSPTNFGSVVVE